jgi:hypothetical protein
MPKAYLAVRAEVPEADRARFDHWYETDHLPWAARVFAARRAWRCWSRTDPPLHIAFYEFDSVEAAEATQTARRPRPWSPISTGYGKVACSAAAKSSKWSTNSRPSRPLSRIAARRAGGG